MKQFIAVIGQFLWRLAVILSWAGKASVAVLFLYTVHTLLFRSVPHGILLMGATVAYLWIMSGVVVLVGLAGEWLRGFATARPRVTSIAHLIPPRLGEWSRR